MSRACLDQTAIAVEDRAVLAQNWLAQGLEITFSDGSRELSKIMPHSIPNPCYHGKGEMKPFPTFLVQVGGVHVQLMPDVSSSES